MGRNEISIAQGFVSQFVFAGTNRTPFLCFFRHQQKKVKLNEKKKWTEKEDERLKKLVHRCRLNNYVPWTKVRQETLNRE